jgi:hypothetical protein
MRSRSSVSASSDSVKSISLWEFTNPKPPQEPEHWPEKTYFWPKKPSLFARSVKLAKAGLVGLGIVSLGALAGVGNYYLNDLSGTPLLVSEGRLGDEERPGEDLSRISATELPTPAPSKTAPPKERLAALLDVPETSDSVVPAAILKQVSMFRASPQDDLPSPTETDVQLAPRAYTPPQEAELPSQNIASLLSEDDARLPRSRPDDIITGSIRPSIKETPQSVSERKSAAAPRGWRRFGPCAALRSLRVPYLFGNRCGRYTHYDPPPPRQDVRVVAAPASVPVQQYSPHPYQPPRVVQD